jgi:hypothetical protein
MTNHFAMDNQPNLLEIEQSLEASLGSVEPDQRFINHLRTQLTKKPDIEIEKKNFLAAYFVVGMGLFFGISAFWLLSQIFKGIRALIFR